MSKSNLALVPFGKYKGQPVEALAQDQDYCEWLAGQDWFRTRYATIHTLIVNNFAEAHETPEHNALQVRFTDDEWVRAFVRAYYGPNWFERVLEQAIRRSHEVCGPVERGIMFLQHGGTQEFIQLYHQHIEWLSSGLQPSVELGAIKYEQRGADVEFWASAGVQTADHIIEARCVTSRFATHQMLVMPCYDLTFRVECKPVVGDDYPATLRQMIAHESNVLLIGTAGYQGIGATYEQMRKIFRASKIMVMLLSEVEANDERQRRNGKAQDRHLGV